MTAMLKQTIRNLLKKAAATRIPATQKKTALRTRQDACLKTKELLIPASVKLLITLQTASAARLILQTKAEAANATLITQSLKKIPGNALPSAPTILLKVLTATAKTARSASREYA